MSLDSAIARFRRRHIDLFRDEVTITRGGSGGTIDPDTGEWLPNTGTVVYAGLGQVRPVSSTVESEALFGGEVVSTQRFVGVFPPDALPRVDDRVAVTESSDPLHTARFFRVVSVASDSWLICRRVGLEVQE